MTLKDCCLLSLHTIKQNRARSILTVIIAAFLSFLIMGTMCLAISFSENSDNVVVQSYFAENSVIPINYSNYRNRAAGQQEVFTEEYYEELSNTFSKYKDIVNYVEYWPSIQTRMSFTDPSFPIYGGIEIIQGRNIQKSELRNEVIVHKDLIESGDYVLGDSYSYEVSYYSESSFVPPVVNFEFIVVGVFDYLEDRTVYVNRFESFFDYNYIIGDIGIIFNAHDTNIYVKSFSACKYVQSRVKNPKRIINRIQNLTNDLNKFLPKVVSIERFKDTATYVTTYRDSVTCNLSVEYAANNLERFFIIIGASVIAIILSFMSLGSLANSVMISIDTSKKFIGLLKAMGMKGKSLKLVVLLESIFLNFVGVLIGYLSLFAVSFPLTSVLKELIFSAYGNYVVATNYIPTMHFPIYVFFGIYLMFIGFVFLFSRSSLRKIAKMEPIRVINEVS